MKAEETHSIDGGGGAAAAGEPLFTEEAEEEARPVVPLARVAGTRPYAGPAPGRLPQGFVLLLAVIAAGAAGATAGLLAYTGRAPQTPAETIVSDTPEADTTRAAVVSNGAETPQAETLKSDVSSRPEPPVTVEPERHKANREEARGRDEKGRAGRVRGGEERGREEARLERRRGSDKERDGERDEERRAVRHEEEKDGKPKARLVGTITGRSRPH